MTSKLRFGLYIVLLAGITSCKSTPAIRSSSIEPSAELAISALQDGKFLLAQEEAQRVLIADPSNSYAHVVAGITLYKRLAHDLTIDISSVIGGAIIMGGINNRYIDWSLNDVADRLDQIAAHLAEASADIDFRFALCLACWNVDWNKDGRINRRDKQLLEIEYDENGDEIQKEDPRRRPRFQFDLGDIYWARAMIDFQRALIAIASAYDYSEVDKLFARFGRGTGVKISSIRIRDKKPIHAARDFFLSGLNHADRARKEYLKETDDQGEWLPNPHQKNHPLPLPVTQGLYDTWAGVLRDLQALISGQEGLSVKALAQLGDHQWEDPPTGFINIGLLFEDPGDLVLNLEHLEAVGSSYSRTKEKVEATLKDFLGNKYVQQMKPSPLTDTFSRIKSEVDKGQESFERKLRYLLWLN